MRYEDPDLRRRLAAEYMLGTMPPRARRRFERLMAADPTLAPLVAKWADWLAPLDDAAPAEEPPARVWQAIERRLSVGHPPALPASPPPPWFASLRFWRSLALAAGAATIALAIYLAAFSGRGPSPAVVAILNGKGGTTGWVGLTIPGSREVSFAAVAPAPETIPHAFELWGIAGGPPQPLGLLPLRTGAALTLRVAQLPAPGSVLAVSLEPPGGSPTGAPTGPVLYSGKVLFRSP